MKETHSSTINIMFVLHKTRRRFDGYDVILESHMHANSSGSELQQKHPSWTQKGKYLMEWKLSKK